MKGTLYLFGGLTPQADATDTLWVFDLAGDRKTGWRRMDFGANGKEEFKPGPRSGHSCVVWSEEKFGRDGKRGKTRRLVLYGGNAPGEVPGFRRDDVWVLDIGGLTSSEGPQVLDLLGSMAPQTTFDLHGRESLKKGARQSCHTGHTTRPTSSATS